MLYINDFLESVHYLNHPYISGLSALAVLSIGVFVLLRNKKSELYRAFFWLSFVLGIWFLGNALSMANFKNTDLAIFWLRVGYTGAIFISATFYNFYLSYFKKNKTILYFIYATAVLEIIYLWFSEDIRMFSYTLPNVGLVWREMPRFSYFLIFGMVKYIIISIAVAASLLKESKKEKILSKKIKLKWLTIVFFVLLLGASEWLVAFNIPLHIAWVVVPLFVGTIAYAILKHQLMDIRIVIKKAFFYSIGIALISGIIVGISFLSSWFTERIPGFQFWIVPVIAGFAAFIIGNVFWQKSKEIEKAYEIEKRAHEELKRLSRAKDEFVLVAQHHLRTPLSIMRGYLSEIKDNKNIDPKIRNRYIDKIYNSNNRIVGLVNELLDIAQMEVYKEPLKIHRANVKVIIEKIVDDLNAEIQEKNLDVRIAPEESWPTIPIDLEKIKIVFSNLISNAVKYTKQGGIIIQGIKTGNHFRVSVKDTGIGINPSDIKTIFSKYFERGEEAKKLYATGRGISLYSTASIIKAHNGRVYAKSEGIDKGSEFVVELPL